MKEWKELEIDNLPPDILTGDYEFLYKLDHLDWDKSDVGRLTMLNNLMNPYGLKYRYRKPEPKQPTHEEILGLKYSSPINLKQSVAGSRVLITALLASTSVPSTRRMPLALPFSMIIFSISL